MRASMMLPAWSNKFTIFLAHAIQKAHVKLYPQRKLMEKGMDIKRGNIHKGTNETGTLIFTKETMEDKTRKTISPNETNKKQKWKQWNIQA